MFLEAYGSLAYHGPQGQIQEFAQGGPRLPFFSSLSLLFLLLSFPSPPLSIPTFPLEEPARGSGERYKLPQLAENEFGAL